LSPEPEAHALSAKNAWQGTAELTGYEAIVAESYSIAFHRVPLETGKRIDGGINGPVGSWLLGFKHVQADRRVAHLHEPRPSGRVDDEYGA
jgi:hypothetical protein